MASAKERAYEHVKALIVNRAVNAGEFMTEAEIAESLGVSRTPVREAFLRLEAEHLVRLIPKKGAIVPPITPRTAREVTEIRRIIELYAAKRALDLNMQIVDRLYQLISKQAELADSLHVSEFLEADRVFHETIVRASGNGLLFELYGSVRDQQMRMGIAAMLIEEGRHESVLREHEAMADGFRRRDVAACMDAIEAHLATTLECLLSNNEGGPF